MIEDVYLDPQALLRLIREVEEVLGAAEMAVQAEAEVVREMWELRYDFSGFSEPAAEPTLRPRVCWSCGRALPGTPVTSSVLTLPADSLASGALPVYCGCRSAEGEHTSQGVAERSCIRRTPPASSTL
jgi:hypothetical protein